MKKMSTLSVSGLLMAILLPAMVILTGCGGGGDDGQPPQPRPLDWDNPGLLEKIGGDAMEPQIAVHSQGNAIVVWEQFTEQDDDPSIYACRYEAVNQEWCAEPELLETNTGWNWFPSIAMDSNGNAIVVWEGPDGIHSNRFNATTGNWEGEVTVETTSPDMGTHIAMDGNGNAIAVWREYNFIDNEHYIKAKRYDVNSGAWDDQSASVKTGLYAFASYDPNIAMDASGNAIVVWLQRLSDDVDHVHANRYTAQSNTWGASHLRIESNSGDAEGLGIAMDPSGNALTVWRQANNSEVGVYVNRYVAGTGWSGEEFFASQNINDGLNLIFYPPDVTMNDRGDALVVWSNFDGSARHLYSRHYTAGSGWEGTSTVGSSSGIFLYPQASLTTAGNAVFLWGQLSMSAPIDIWSNNYDAGRGWSSPQSIEDSSEEIFLDPWWRVDMDDNGNALAVWVQSDGAYLSIYANHGSIQ